MTPKQLYERAAAKAKAGGKSDAEIKAELGRLAAAEKQRQAVEAAKPKNQIKKVVKKVGSAVKTGAQAVGKAVGSTAKNVGKTVAKVINGGQVAATMALFAPLSPVARMFLKKRGITPAKDLQALALQVQNEMGKKSFAYEGADSFDYGTPAPDELGTFDAEGIELENYGMVITPDMILAVVKFLKGIFDRIKEKKAKGETLSEDEKAIDKQAPEIDKALGEAKKSAEQALNESEKKAVNILSGENPAGGFSWKIAIAVVVLLILFILFIRR